MERQIKNLSSALMTSPEADEAEKIAEQIRLAVEEHIEDLGDVEYLGDDAQSLPLLAALLLSSTF